MNAPVRTQTETPATDFARRHVGPSPRDVEVMVEAVGAKNLEALIGEVIPPSIRLARPLALPAALSETEALARMREIAAQNQVFVSLIGQGYHGTVLPPVIQRNVLENPAWYTAYTPYQPEISQGRLEALMTFQTMVADLTGLPIANASLLDEATAAAEAMTLARRAAKSKAAGFFVDRNVHPQTLAVLETRAAPLGISLVVGDPDKNLEPEAVFGALLQYPDTFGAVRDPRAVIEKVHAAGGIAVMAADPLALVLLVPPGELGCDVAIGSTQRFGVPMGFGGPHAAYMAVRKGLERTMPGRLVGLSVDSRGNPAYRLALQTREQHIRREKATSNICTAQVLLAVIAAMYAVHHGPEGLIEIARRVHRHAAVLAAGLRRLGVTPLAGAIFDTVTVPVGDRQADILSRAREARINLREIPAGIAGPEAAIGIALDETTGEAVIEAVWRAFSGGGALRYDEVAGTADPRLPPGLVRTSAFLEHPVFHKYRSETEMMRYLRKLSDRDLALDRAMIPLGSCTMKLNATAEMMPITWPEFSSLHPFVPAEQAKGYALLADELSRMLAEITGYDAVSLQPNAGSQGEYAGLLAIRAYHASRGEEHRTVCLIPASAHGTNPASATMAGMTVVVVGCDRDGNIDLADLRAKAAAHAEKLACAMITYPSTHGVFEEAIREMCETVHANGGQVYLDGANLNAQVGLARLGDYGGDVSHINLHKTFCIPHGGGGPGMGPIGVKAHLAPFLPGDASRPGATGAVSAAPLGSASILPISTMYVLMMGEAGLRRATEVAILSANYVAKRLAPYFPVLYRNGKGRVAHECIVDPRALKESTGTTVDDIAKRLIDYGFHAPTVSFPVAGTLMIEPTESESKAELDRFVAAMIAIRKEISAIEEGRMEVGASPLRHAPHTVHDLADDDWSRPYKRAEGCFPDGVDRLDKYFAPVNRIDAVYGDRHLVCACPPVSAYGG
ncbi:Glycine dehydrogenase [decarboxylating] (glycine cleavage system P protein) [Rhodovulum sp. PH10]|uniref:aminomethyl-transferring glycine dehydrogenase n=1 Tax=Rhodovulum sp. PH10 TaxID=1187851 RepID=UPI00027C214B|nr:aminomethyl-transferring glycine dehydrogenase [Rhodovulum sp. PH10]EJW13548.1 Glycine dehydrogenase [decarboxylating] (glycine cleavage system P protein) [Rhodovulum sp. PH10]